MIAILFIRYIRPGKKLCPNKETWVEDSTFVYPNYNLYDNDWITIIDTFHDDKIIYKTETQHISSRR